MRNFLKEIFQDIDGGFSMKRTIALILLVTIVAIVLYVAHYGIAVQMGTKTINAIPAATLDFLRNALEHLLDGLKWVVALIATEQASKFAPAKNGGAP